MSIDTSLALPYDIESIGGGCGFANENKLIIEKQSINNIDLFISFDFIIYNTAPIAVLYIMLIFG